MFFYNQRIPPTRLKNRCKNPSLYMPCDLCMFAFMITCVPCIRMKRTYMAKHRVEFGYCLIQGPLFEAWLHLWALGDIPTKLSHALYLFILVWIYFGNGHTFGVIYFSMISWMPNSCIKLFIKHALIHVQISKLKENQKEFFCKQLVY